ncbi:gliding motility-associated C-terminal domain-containing protein [Bacteroidota bacterium]
MRFVRNFNIRSFYLLAFVFLYIPDNTFAQCDSTVPTFVVDFTTGINSQWISPSIARQDNCCGTTSPVRCIKFIMTLPQNVSGILFDIYSGAVPPGALFYQIGCGPQVQVGDSICLDGPGPHILTFCKPGNNINQYTIRTFPNWEVSNDIVVNDGCTGYMKVSGFNVGTIKWNSVYPDTFGAYNSYLSCSTACDSTVVTGQAGYPAYVDYQVCGLPAGGCDTATVCDTIRAYFNSTLAVNILPEEPTICFGSTFVTISANGSGGTPPYRYVWSTADTSQFIDADTGIYFVTVYDTSNCPPNYDTVLVTAFSDTIEAYAGPDLLSCDTFVYLSGEIEGAPGGTWIGGNGTFIPSRDSLNVTYVPTLSELDSGVVRYMLKTTGNGSCPPDSDEVIVLFRKFIDTVVGLVSSISCSGMIDGSVQLNLTPGLKSPYQFDWSHGDSVQTITDLPQGIYNVTITDSGGCTYSDSFIILEPLPLQVLHDSTNVTCYGGSDGSATVYVSGGTPGYTYNWQLGGSYEYLLNLPVGEYLVTVSDSHNCVITDSITVVQPPELSISPVITHALCYGDSNGSIILNLSGGISPYGTFWSNGDTTENTFSLKSGSYSIQVYDMNFCILEDTFEILEPTPLMLGDTIIDVSCAGVGDGSVSVSISGSVPPYTYAWSNFKSTSTNDSIAGGTYFLTVTDSNSCTLLDSFIVFEPDSLILTSTFTNISCYGKEDGQISVSAQGGIPPYSYYWSHGDTNSTINSLGPGTYYVSVTDQNNCTVADSVVIIEPTILYSIGSVMDVRCYGTSLGKIQVIAMGGTSPYSYSWTGGGQNALLDSIPVGTYVVTIRDTNLCIHRDTFTVIQPDSLSVSAKITHVCQNMNNGKVDITVSGGTSPYTYLWSNSANMQDIAGLAKGIYTVTITDDLGCKLVRSFEVLESIIPMQISFASDRVSCYGFDDGLADALVNGGTPPFSFSWSTGDTTKGITNLGPGSYRLIVMDSLGCKDTAVAVITEPMPLVLNLVKTDISCFGFDNGSASSFVSGGTPPYSYCWDCGVYTADMYNLKPGAYELTLSDSSSCTVVDTAQIIEPPELLYNKLIEHISCFGESDGRIILDILDGTPPYRFVWSSGDTTQNLLNRLAGNYYLTIIEANNCITIDSITLTEPPELVLTYAKQDETCVGDMNGSIDVNVSGGTLPYTFMWSGGQNTEDIFNLSAGQYQVFVTDSHDCKISTPMITIVSNPLPKPSVFPRHDTTICKDDTIGLRVIEAFYTDYLWSNNDQGQAIIVSEPGVYFATVTDTNGCKGKTGDIEIIRIDPAVWLSLEDEYKFCPDDGPLHIRATSHPYGTFYWQPNGEITPDIWVYNEGVFILTYNLHGCSVNDSLDVIEACPPILHVPNVFTPNGDGLNDIFDIFSMYVDQMHYIIFDRWGEIIYRGNSMDDRWDGKFKGEEVQMDVYGYIIWYSSNEFGDFRIHGRVTVLK